MDNNFIFWLWDLEYTKLNRSSEVVFNDDSISSARLQPWTGKRVSFNYSPTEAEAEMLEVKPKPASESTNRTEQALVEETLSSVPIRTGGDTCTLWFPHGNELVEHCRRISLYNISIEQGFTQCQPNTRIDRRNWTDTIGIEQIGMSPKADQVLSIGLGLH